MLVCSILRLVQILETVSFSLDGIKYVINVSAAHVAWVRSEVRLFTDSARPGTPEPVRRLGAKDVD